MADQYANMPPELHPANYTMKAPQQRQQSIAPPSTQIDPTDLQAVKTMVWRKLVETAAIMPPSDKCLPILRELLDRIDGKSMQRVQTASVVTTVDMVALKQDAERQAQDYLDRLSKVNTISSDDK